MDHHLLPVRGVHHDSTHVQRFDPRYWTINFPRPMMGSVITTAPDALSVRVNFTRRNQIAGLIWDSADTVSHPLFSYQTRRDYRGAVLSFRWQSNGVRPLDAVHGPVLTIEGRDTGGAPRAWYVRLWNYAAGSPNDCIITLPFDTVNGGFLLPAEADPVFAGDVDRMFIALSPPDYDATDTPVASFAAGQVMLSNIRCTGAGAMLSVGDAMVPATGLHMATGYDDLYNQTPERVLSQIAACGYSGDLVHYVGMSHFMRLGGNGKIVGSGDPLNESAAVWHADFFARARAHGFAPIASLSYELFADYAPPEWAQRASNGDIALTGWVPPSTLLSPASPPAMAWLQGVAARFVDVMQDAGVPVRFQIGEPWWWTDAGGRIYLYDDAAKVAFGGNPPVITDVGGPLSAAHIALLDAAGAVLAASTAGLTQAVRTAAGTAGAEVMLLAYLPTVLDPARPHLKRANMPVGWAAPAFDTVQLEDYDWAATGALAQSDAGVTAALARLNYPLAETHYFAGFVLNASDAGQWRAILSAAKAGQARGHARVVLWAWPQVARDGLVIGSHG